MREKAEDLECLCKIMNTVGRRLDHDKAKVNSVFLLVPKWVCVCGGVHLEFLCEVMNTVGYSLDHDKA